MKIVVAPLAGARIEIGYMLRQLRDPESLPSRERGLKLQSPHNADLCLPVAPLAGARIEILQRMVHETKAHCRSPRGSAD